MRKPIAPRFLLLLILFAAIFTSLVYLQFAKRNNFTIREGHLVIRGNYASGSGYMPNTYSLAGKTSVIFGGMEFILGKGLEYSGIQISSFFSPALPQSMTITDNEVYFRLTEGPALVFSTQFTGGSIELVIQADFSETISGSDEFKYHSLKIPFKALPTSMVLEKNRQMLIYADEVNYIFSRNTEKDHVILETQNPIISYRVLPDREMVNPQDFFVAAALNEKEYEAALALWLDQSYMLWNRTIASGGEVNGDLICAYMSEALKRGTYKAAAAAVSASWNPANTFYEGSAYIGRLDTALRTLSPAERERSARLSRLFNEKSTDFLKESGIIEFLAIRGYGNLMDDAAEILRAFDPAGMTVEQAAGILEGCLEWGRYRPGRYNPFDRFVDQAMFVITGNLRRNSRAESSLIFAKTGSSEEEADIEVNLRIARSLLQFNDETRKTLGKTLIVSVLSMADRSYAVPVKVRNNFTGDRERLDSQKIYRIFFSGENYARAQAAGSGLWAWTAASQVNVSTSAGKTEFSVYFPAGETHYMMIRGVKPFTSLLFSDILYNQNSQFERYDYSGWTYSAPEQTLLVKIRHRLPIERITIIY